MIRIAIIGLGQIGASIGLALNEKKELIYRTGYDRDSSISQQAEKKGALDKMARSLEIAVEDADLVLLALPTDQIKETLVQLAPYLKESAVVMDTAPVKERVAAWAKETLPPDRHYVGLTPVIGPAYLETHDYGIDAAHADLFRGGMMVIVAPPNTLSDAIKLAADLARLLGANSMFADPIEIDGLMAATHILPQLLAAALLNATVDQPGWRERSKVAGKAYAEVTGPVVQLGDAESLCSAAMLSGENLVRLTDSVIAILQNFRNDIENQDGNSLTERLERARVGREAWWKERHSNIPPESEMSPKVEAPQPSDYFARLLGLGGRKLKPKK